MKLFKIKTNKIEKKLIAGKKINQTEHQLFLEQEEKGFIIVEQSEINKNTFLYRKKLKSGNKSSRVVFLKRDEIFVISEVKEETKKEKRMKDYKGLCMDLETKKCGVLKGCFNNKKEFMNRAEELGYITKTMFIKEKEVFEGIRKYNDDYLFSRIHTKEDFERYDETVKKHQKLYDTKVASRDMACNIYEKLINVAKHYEVAYLIRFTSKNEKSCYGKLTKYIEAEKYSINLSLDLFIKKERSVFCMVETFAHELAHLTIWNHGTKHRIKTFEIMEELLNVVGDKLC